MRIQVKFHLRRTIIFSILVFLSLLPCLTLAQEIIPAPESVIGFKIGSDYKLADYEQSIRYFKKLDSVSNRLRLIKVGYTSFGRPWYLALISSAKNLENIEHYRKINQRIAHPKGLTSEEALQFAKEGLVFVDISGGLHANEVAGAQHTILLAYNLLSARNKPEIERIFDEVVLMLWPTLNPDGQDIVVHWYRKIKDTKYKKAPVPRLWQKYVGHDNNRDGYMLNLQESRVVAHTWRYWEPHIIHVHHQFRGGDTNFRIWLPPFAAPVGAHTPPLILREINALGMLMALELESRGLRGATHKGEGYDAWYAGYSDYMPVYLNIAAYWTETFANHYANPRFIPKDSLLKEGQSFRPHALYASPWKGGWWRLSDQINYMLAASYAVLEYASKYSNQIIYNRYQAGMKAIQYYSNHAPYAYIIPQRQWDPMAAVEMLQRLAFSGICVYQLKQEASVGGESYTAGTWVIPTSQAFGRLVEEVLEVQDYPEIQEYPGGPLEQPYDAAGWTLPYLMDVNVITVKEPLSEAFLAAMKPVKGEPIPWEASQKASLLSNPVAAGIVAPAGTITGLGSGLALNPAENNTFILINRALVAGGVVTYAKKGVNDWPGGNYIVTGIGKNTLKAWVKELALHAQWTENTSGAAVHSRIGIYSPWTASIDEGWTRWLLDKYSFQYKRIRNSEIKNGNLDEKFDAIILASIRPETILNGYSNEEMLPRYAGGIGEKGVQALKSFVRNGGTLVCLSKSCKLAIKQFNLPVKNVVDGLSRKEFFVSGSILKVTVNQSHPVMAGMPKQAKIFFSRSPAFATLDGFKGRILAKYPAQDSLLLSGYLLGAEHLKGHAAALDVHYGEGHILLIGFRPQWRGQTFGTFRILFNAILYNR